MQSKGLDPAGKVFAKAAASQLIHSLRIPAARGRIEWDGKKDEAIP